MSHETHESDRVCGMESRRFKSDGVDEHSIEMYNTV